MDTQKSKSGATERRRRRETTTHEVEDEYDGLEWDAKARKANILKRFVSKSKCGFKLLSRFPVTPRDYSSSSASSSSNEETTRSKGKSSGTKVCLNVYDLTPMNGCVYWAGLGIFHSGVEVHGVEYAFGAHDYPTSGVFEVEPRQCPGFTFRKSIFIGTTQLSPSQLREFMENIAGAYNGDSYHLIAKNCNHFCNDICMKLTGKPIPGWVNRLARIGSVCNCLLPESLHVSAVRHEPDYQSFWSKKNIRRSLFQLSVSRSDYFVGEKQMSHSSMLLSHSPFKGSVLPWEFKSSTTVKER